MNRGRLLISVLFVVAVACKKDQPNGLPPAQDWQGSSAQAQAGGTPPASSNPHAGMDPSNPHGGMGSASNPHAGMDMSNSNPHAGMQADTTPKQVGPHTLEKAGDRSILGPFTLAVPSEWTEKPVTSSMRAADFVLSAKPGEEAEMIVYYFGEGGAGNVQANTDRWLDQIIQADGKKSRDVAKIENTKFGGQDAIVITVSGRYSAAAMPGAAEQVNKDNQTLLAAIVSSPKGPFYFKLVGAKATVDAQMPKIRAMLSSMQPR